MLPAIATDLQRMGNWRRPMWFMPVLDDNAELDEARVAISLALSRKIDGIVSPAGTPPVSVGSASVVSNVLDVLDKLPDRTEPIAGYKLESPVKRLDWQMPFPAQWRVDFVT